ncbi:D-glycero-beta-D-manno-heptose 1-phosphate adenylyltransferase [Fusibacter paucivorans]|uniref:Bifunctional protein HldE n=1 Tax=Fusibacter paucivorans TaxID=76009 RepID=A0ABS5PPU1_9FIRM|nr:D-glycero-beta-D-manno-heptose 1-phosphate adenylyltransferase [Fusibacter paucivorans]MBS7526606.1 D-glycero-beta-D-manno-heptose 1-phosphate adenylyltransferase [Fusibacter paucivorans]
MIDLERLQKQHVLVVGDMMIDKYISGSVERISPEAPVVVLNQREVSRKLGGTGNVIINITSLGANVRALGRIGDDEEGLLFRDTLKQHGVDDSYIFNEGSTIIKTRVSANNQQFIRIDEEIITPPSLNVLNKICSEIDVILKDITVVIISDYAKGFITNEIAQCIIKNSKLRSIPVFVDPKGKSIDKYRGATGITPNNKEFLDLTELTGVPDENIIKEIALKLCAENDFDYLIFTRSEKGISIINRDEQTKRDFPTVVKEVVDVTGAGDTVISMIALTMSAGFSIETCMKIANIAASIVISKFGAAQTTVKELDMAINPRFVTIDDLMDILEEIDLQRNRGKKIVFTNGCFDIVHAGHVSSFIQAKSFGDILIVGVNSDASISRLKGKSRPIVDLKNRIALLSAFECVDYVIPFDDDTPQTLIEALRPDVLVKGKDWEGKAIAGGDFVISYGGNVKFIDLEQGLSTTSIIDKIRKATE